MIDSKEFVELQQDKTSKSGFKLATVMELSESGTAKIKFYGEDVQCEKEYSYLASYTPSLNDTVLVAAFEDTYIILGKILFQANPVNFITEENKETALQDYVKNEQLEDFITKTDADLVYATNDKIKGFIKSGDSIEGLSMDDIVITDSLIHRGFYITFFNGPYLQSKSPVSPVSSTADLDAVRTGLNKLITALNKYNLV